MLCLRLPILRHRPRLGRRQQRRTNWSGASGVSSPWVRAYDATLHAFRIAPMSLPHGFGLVSIEQDPRDTSIALDNYVGDATFRIPADPVLPPPQVKDAPTAVTLSLCHFAQSHREPAHRH